ncbi:MAG: PAS domain-containing protein [Flavobacteriales bacterium]
MRFNHYDDKNEEFQLLIQKHFGTHQPECITSFMKDFQEKFSENKTNLDLEYENILNKLNKNNDELLKLQSDLIYAQRISRTGSFYIDFISQESRFSEMAAELIGFTSPKQLEFSESLIYKLRQNILKEDLGLIDKVWMQAIKEQKEFDIEFRVRGVDGKIKHISWTLKNTFDDSGKLIKVAGTLQDISTRIENERKDKIASLILEKSKVILIKWSREPGYPVKYVSKNIEQFGYSPEELLADDFRFEQIIYQEDRERLKKELQDYRNNNTPEYTLQYRILNSSGKVCWIRDQSFIMKNDNVEEVYGLITDITSKVQAEEQLKISEEKFRTLIQNFSDIVTILDDKGNIIYESPSFYKIFEYEPDEILGRNGFEFVHPDDLEHTLSSFSNLVKDSIEGNPVVYRFRAKSGNYKYIESVATNLINHPHIQGVVVNTRDISERIENERQLKIYTENLERINKELDQFAYIVSHDLKAPLRAIYNLSEWIQEDLEDKLDEGNKEHFELLRSRIKRLENLIIGILEYSRAGKKSADISEFKGKEAICELIDSIGPPANAEIVVQNQIPSFHTEKLLIEQVFSNFISNAIKYNDKDSLKLEIGYKSNNDNTHCFYIKDNGPGIPEEYYEKVFGIFQTLQSRDVVESTGIGLAIVKKIVEDKGGRVWLESEIGKGSCFYFTWN